MKFSPIVSLLPLLLLGTTSFAQDEGAAAVAPCDCKSECESLVTAKQNDLSSKHAKEISSIQAKLDASLKQAESTEAALNESQKSVTELQTSLSALEGKAGDTEKELTLTIAAHADTQAQLNAAQKDVESLKNELETVKERELAFQKEAEAGMESLHQEMEDLINHKIKASQLEEHIETLQKDLEDHRDELTTTKSSLSKELDDHKQELLLMRQKSLKDQELINEFHEQALKTYINTTLIYQDASIGANKAMQTLGEWYTQALEASAPHYNQAVEMYKQHAEPHVNAAAEHSQKLYDQHLKETVDRDVLPALKPAIEVSSEYLNKAHAVSSEGISAGADTAYTYLKIMADDSEEDETGWRRWFAHQFRWVKENAGKVVTNITYGVLIFLFLWMFVLPRRKPTKPVDSEEASAATPGRRRKVKGSNKKNNGSTKLKSQ